MPDTEKTRPKRSFAFIGTLAIAVVAYLLTNEIVVAVILPCLHGGWHTLETGIWLLKSDPDRCRARVCFAFYFATACWKAAAAALFTVPLLIVVESMTGVQPNMDEFAATMCVVAAGLAFNTLVGIGATIAAAFYKIRVWVHPRFRSLVDDDLSMVAELAPRLYGYGFNHAIFVVATALVFPLLCIGAVYLVYATVGKTPNDFKSTSALLFTLVAMFGGPIAMIPCYLCLSSRIIATNPQECWPQDTVQIELNL